MKQTLESATKEAIHAHYNCNGKYPCDWELSLLLMPERNN